VRNFLSQILIFLLFYSLLSLNIKVLKKKNLIVPFLREIGCSAYTETKGN
jgi:hypothetical protein